MRRYRGTGEQSPTGPLPISAAADVTTGKLTLQMHMSSQIQLNGRLQEMLCTSSHGYCRAEAWTNGS